MLIKVYLGVSALAFILIMLKSCSLTNRLGRTERAYDMAGTVLVIIKLALTCLIPVYNIIVIYAILLCGSEIDRRVLDKKSREDDD